jgi:hypothetical protein
MAKSDQVRAQVMAGLIAGQGVRELAREFKLSPSTVHQWKLALPQEIEQNRTQKHARDFGEMLGTYLEALLGTATCQMEIFRDPKWLTRQSASDLAVLHGVLVDKGIRLLEAAERAGTTVSEPAEHPNLNRVLPGDASV